MYEVYGTSEKKIKIYDLFAVENKHENVGFDPDAPEKHWENMKGHRKFPVENLELNKIAVKNFPSAFEAIDEGYITSHFAPTATSKESTRGHIVIIATITHSTRMANQEKDKSPPAREDTSSQFTTSEVSEEKDVISEYEDITGKLIFVDLAPSSGLIDSPSFHSRVDDDYNEKRKKENIGIDHGLFALQEIFVDLKQEGKLENNKMVGIKQLLFPYINFETEIGIFFHFSPLLVDKCYTDQTLKYIRGFTELKPSEVQGEKYVDWENVVKLLEKEKEKLKRMIPKKILEKKCFCLSSNLDVEKGDLFRVQGSKKSETNSDNFSEREEIEITIDSEDEDGVYSVDETVIKKRLLKMEEKERKEVELKRVEACGINLTKLRKGEITLGDEFYTEEPWNYDDRDMKILMDLKPERCSSTELIAKIEVANRRIEIEECLYHYEQQRNNLEEEYWAKVAAKLNREIQFHHPPGHDYFERKRKRVKKFLTNHKKNDVNNKPSKLNQ
jgi:hypothetical protein